MKNTFILRKTIQPLIFEPTRSTMCSKPTSDELVAKLLPVLTTITKDKECQNFSKSQKLMEIISYEPSGNIVFCPLRLAQFSGGYYACIPKERALKEYKQSFKTAKGSYKFICLSVLSLEHHLNMTDTFLETKDLCQLDYPLWIWTTYNALCYHCIIFKDYSIAETLCSLLEDFISDFLCKVRSDIM